MNTNDPAILAAQCACEYDHDQHPMKVVDSGMPWVQITPRHAMRLGMRLDRWVEERMKQLKKRHARGV